MLKSFHSDKIEIRDNAIAGKGSFAKESIKRGEIVAIKAGHIISQKYVGLTDYGDGSFWSISDDYFLGTLSKDEAENLKIYINHSCDPNCGCHGQIAVVAMRDISAGEELTQDYAMIDDMDWTMECHCGVPNCRHIITGKDWKIKALQEKYNGYFNLFIQEKIDNQ